MVKKLPFVDSVLIVRIMETLLELDLPNCSTVKETLLEYSYCKGIINFLNSFSTLVSDLI